MSQKNITTIRRAYEMFAKGEFASLPFDPEIEWTEPDVEEMWSRGTHHGPDAVIKNVFEPTFANFDEFRLQCDEFIDAGDRVFVTGRFLGRGKDTGNERNAPFVHIWKLRNGKAVSFRDCSDTANWLQALCRVHIERPVGAHR